MNSIILLTLVFLPFAMHCVSVFIIIRKYGVSRLVLYSGIRDVVFNGVLPSFHNKSP